MQHIDDVKKFVVNTFMFGDDQGLSEHTSFLGSRVVDSTGMLELVSFIEDRFGICIEDHELMPENLDSLGQIAAFLERKLDTNQNRDTGALGGW